MNKKIILSLSVIGVVAAIAVGGTIAYFSDTETSVGNTFTAGTIDISLDPKGGQAVKTVSGDLDLKPSQTGWTKAVVTNVGTNPAEIWKHIGNVENREHSIVEPEQEYYDEHSGSENWKISNWIHYDMEVLKSLDYSFDGISKTYSLYKPEGIDVDITVEDLGCYLKWTFDFPIDNDPSNGNMGYGLVLSLDGVHPEFQIHNNDGTCPDWNWGTHLYSEYDGGWHTGGAGCADTNKPVSELGWIEATGHRYKVGKPDDPESNSEGVFTVIIDKNYLEPEVYWAVHFGAGGFYNYGGLSKYPEAWTPWSGDASTFESAGVYELLKQIVEEEGFYLTPNPQEGGGVESNWIYLGELEPEQSMCVKQSYHLDSSVGNWAQSDRVFFDVDFMAQQTEGSPQPDAPKPVLDGYGRSN